MNSFHTLSLDQLVKHSDPAESFRWMRGAGVLLSLEDPGSYQAALASLAPRVLARVWPSLPDRIARRLSAEAAARVLPWFAEAHPSLVDVAQRGLAVALLHADGEATRRGVQAAAREVRSALRYLPRHEERDARYVGWAAGNAIRCAVCGGAEFPLDRDLLREALRSAVATHGYQHAPPPAFLRDRNPTWKARYDTAACTEEIRQAARALDLLYPEGQAAEPREGT